MCFCHSLSLIYPTKIASAAAVLELGALIGALTAGIFTNRYSRGTSIIAACCKSSFCIELSSFYIPGISCFLYRFYISMCGNHSGALIHRTCYRRNWGWCAQVLCFISHPRSRLKILNTVCYRPCTWLKLVLPKFVGLFLH